MDRLLIVPAAGRGSRLGADLPKALVPVCGRPMLTHLLTLHRPRIDAAIVVVAPDALEAFDAFRVSSSAPFELATQASPTGMLDAILAARTTVLRDRPRRIVVTWCDQIAIHADTVERVASAALAADAPAIVFPTFNRDTPYIHFDRDQDGRIVHVRQRREGDEMPEIGETDVGLFDLSLEAYATHLQTYADRALLATGTGERNFLPFIPWLSERASVRTVAARSHIETIGINTPEELLLVERHLCGAALP